MLPFDRDILSNVQLYPVLHIFPSKLFVASKINYFEAFMSVLVFAAKKFGNYFATKYNTDAPSRGGLEVERTTKFK